MDDKEENRIKRRYTSILAAAILAMYTGFILYNKPVNGSVDLDAVDYTVISVCVAILLAVEAVKYMIRKKTGFNKNQKDA